MCGSVGFYELSTKIGHGWGQPWLQKRPVECRSLYEMLCSLYLDEAENHFAFLGDHVLIPWWIPDDVDFRVGNARNTE